MSMSSRVSGQSSVELLVSAAFIVPIVIMMATLANFLLVQTEAHKAGRYVAWERTAYAAADLKPAEEMASDIEKRFLVDPESSFGNTVKSTFRAPWRDWHWQRSGDDILDVGNQAVVIDRDNARSATAANANASAWLAGRGGRSDPANAVSIDTLQLSRVSIPLDPNASILQATKPHKIQYGDETLTSFWSYELDYENSPAPPEDSIAETNRYSIASSSALVSDSWAPANETMFRDRVSGMNSASRAFQRGWEGVLAPVRGVFDELEDHLYVGSPIAESYNMVDSHQSTVLPTSLKEYVAP